MIRVWQTKKRLSPPEVGCFRLRQKIRERPKQFRVREPIVPSPLVGEGAERALASEAGEGARATRAAWPYPSPGSISRRLQIDLSPLGEVKGAFADGCRSRGDAQRVILRRMRQKRVHARLLFVRRASKDALGSRNTDLSCPGGKAGPEGTRGCQGGNIYIDPAADRSAPSRSSRLVAGPGRSRKC